MRNALTAAAAEMDVTIWRTSRSTIVRELLDYSTAVFDRGRLQRRAVRPHPAAPELDGRRAADRARDFLPLDEWEEGDVVITNDPYCGGQHIPDILAFRAVFVDGARVAIVGTLCHHLDMGGISAGSYGATATEVFQEGLRIPPMKLLRRGVLNAEVLAHDAAERAPPGHAVGRPAGAARLAGGGRGQRGKLAARYGAATLVAACARILDGSEAAMRAMIGRMPDGRYEFEDWIDDDGLTEAPIRIHAAIDIAGEEMVVDLSGCGAAGAGPGQRHARLVRLRRVLRGDGLRGRADPGQCRLLPPGAGGGARGLDRARAAPGAGGQPDRDDAPAGDDAAGRAAPGGAGPHPGRLLRRQLRLHVPDHRRGRRARRAGGDRGRRRRRPPGAGRAERLFQRHAQQRQHPGRDDRERAAADHRRYGLLPGTAGAGRFRGGLGLVREWRIDCPEAVFTANLERFKVRPYGLAGGEPGAAGRLWLLRDGERQPLPSKVGNLRLRRGDVIRLETSGGGGHGEPAARAPEAVASDRAQGYVA